MPSRAPHRTHRTGAVGMLAALRRRFFQRVRPLEDRLNVSAEVIRSRVTAVVRRQRIAEVPVPLQLPGEVAAPEIERRHRVVLQRTGRPRRRRCGVPELPGRRAHDLEQPPRGPLKLHLVSSRVRPAWVEPAEVRLVPHRERVSTRLFLYLCDESPEVEPVLLRGRVHEREDLGLQVRGRRHLLPNSFGSMRFFVNPLLAFLAKFAIFAAWPPAAFPRAMSEAVIGSPGRLPSQRWKGPLWVWEEADISGLLHIL